MRIGIPVAAMFVAFFGGELFGAQIAEPPGLQEMTAKLEERFENRPEPLADDYKAALRDVLRETLSRKDILVPYDRMSPERRRRFEWRAAFFIGMGGHLNSPLQREKDAMEFRLQLLKILNKPVFEPTGSADVHSEFEALAKAIGKSAARMMPDAPHDAAARVEADVLRMLERRAGDDMFSEGKYPLSKTDFAKLLPKVTAGCEETFTSYLADENVQRMWDTLPAEKSWEWSSHLASGAAKRSLVPYWQASSKAILQGPYTQADLDRAANPLSPEEIRNLEDLRRRAAEESQVLWEREVARERMMDITERVERQLMEDLPKELGDLERILAEDGADTPEAPLEVTPPGPAELAEAPAENAAQSGSRVRSALVAAGAFLAAIAAAFLLLKFYKRKVRG